MQPSGTSLSANEDLSSFSAVVSPWRNSPTLDALRSGTLQIESRNSLTEIPDFEISEKISRLDTDGFVTSFSVDQFASNSHFFQPVSVKGQDVLGRHQSATDQSILKTSSDYIALEVETDSRNSHQILSTYGASQSSILSVQLAAVIYRIRELCSELQQYSTTVWFDYRRYWQEEKRYQAELREARARVESVEASMRQMQNSLNMYQEIERVRSKDDDRQEKLIEDLRRFLESERQLRLEADEMQTKAASAWAEKDERQQHMIVQVKKQLQLQRSKSEQLDVTVQQLLADLELERAQQSEDTKLRKYFETEFQKCQVRLEEEMMRCTAVEQSMSETLSLYNALQTEMIEKNLQFANTMEQERQRREHTEKLLNAATEALKAESDYAEAKILEEISLRQAAERARKELDGKYALYEKNAESIQKEALRGFIDIKEAMVKYLKPWIGGVSTGIREQGSCQRNVDCIIEMIEQMPNAIQNALNSEKHAAAEGTAKFQRDLGTIMQAIVTEIDHCAMIEEKLKAASQSMMHQRHIELQYNHDTCTSITVLDNKTDGIIELLQQLQIFMHHKISAEQQTTEQARTKLQYQISIRQQAEDRLAALQGVLESKQLLCDSQQHELEGLRREAVTNSRKILDLEENIHQLNCTTNLERTQFTEAAAQNSFLLEKLEKYRRLLAEETLQKEFVTDRLKFTEMEVKRLEGELEENKDYQRKYQADIDADMEILASRIQLLTTQHVKLLQQLEVALQQSNSAHQDIALRFKTTIFESNDVPTDSVSLKAFAPGFIKLFESVAELDATLRNVRCKYAERDNQREIQSTEAYTLIETLRHDSKELEMLLLDSKSSARALETALQEIKMTTISRIEAEQAIAHESQNYLRKVQCLNNEFAHERTRKENAIKQLCDAQLLLVGCHKEIDTFKSEFASFVKEAERRFELLKGVCMQHSTDVAQIKQKMLSDIRHKEIELGQRDEQLKGLGEKLQSVLRNLKQNDEVANIRVEKEIALRKQFEIMSESEHQQRRTLECEIERLQTELHRCNLELEHSNSSMQELTRQIKEKDSELRKQQSKVTDLMQEMDEHKNRIIEQAQEFCRTLHQESTRRKELEDLLDQEAIQLQDLMSYMTLDVEKVSDLMFALQSCFEVLEIRAENEKQLARGEMEQRITLQNKVDSDRETFLACSMDLEKCQKKLTLEQNRCMALRDSQQKAKQMMLALSEELALQDQEFCGCFEELNTLLHCYVSQRSQQLSLQDIFFQEAQMLDDFSSMFSCTESKLQSLAHVIKQYCEKSENQARQSMQTVQALESALLAEQAGTVDQRIKIDILTCELKCKAEQMIAFKSLLEGFDKVIAASNFECLHRDLLEKADRLNTNIMQTAFELNEERVNHANIVKELNQRNVHDESVIKALEAQLQQMQEAFATRLEEAMKSAQQCRESNRAVEGQLVMEQSLRMGLEAEICALKLQWKAIGIAAQDMKDLVASIINGFEVQQRQWDGLISEHAIQISQLNEDEGKILQAFRREQDRCIEMEILLKQSQEKADHQTIHCAEMKEICKKHSLDIETLQSDKGKYQNLLHDSESAKKLLANELEVQRAAYQKSRRNEQCLESLMEAEKESRGELESTFSKQAQSLKELQAKFAETYSSLHISNELVKVQREAFLCFRAKEQECTIMMEYFTLQLMEIQSEFRKTCSEFQEQIRRDCESGTFSGSQVQEMINLRAQAHEHQIQLSTLDLKVQNYFLDLTHFHRTKAVRIEEDKERRVQLEAALAVEKEHQHSLEHELKTLRNHLCIQTEELHRLKSILRHHQQEAAESRRLLDSERSVKAYVESTLQHIQLHAKHLSEELYFLVNEYQEVNILGLNGTTSRGVHELVSEQTCSILREKCMFEQPCFSRGSSALSCSATSDSESEEDRSRKSSLINCRSVANRSKIDTSYPSTCKKLNHQFGALDVLKSDVDILPDDRATASLQTRWDHLMQEIKMEREERRNRDQLYVKMQDELSVLQERLRHAEAQSTEAKAKLEQQRGFFEAQLENLMNACKAEEIVGDEARKREAEALAQLSMSYCWSVTPNKDVNRSGAGPAHNNAFEKHRETGHPSTLANNKWLTAVTPTRTEQVYTLGTPAKSVGDRWAWSPGVRDGSRTAR